jgi:hypothetical protein
MKIPIGRILCTSAVEEAFQRNLQDSDDFMLPHMNRNPTSGYRADYVLADGTAIVIVTHFDNGGGWGAYIALKEEAAS